MMNIDASPAARADGIGEPRLPRAYRMNPSDFEHIEFDPATFSGTVRMFPIPNMVMFPHVVQPLHVFEERYREMMQDALATDRLIAMPVLKPGWEPEYAGRPPVERSACLGKVVLHNKLPDGCYNLLLMGVSRLRIDEELEPVRSFRRAKAEIVADVCPCPDSEEAVELHEQLSKVFDDCVVRGDAPHSLKQLLEGDVPLAQLSDLMAYALPLPTKAKIALLAERCVVERTHRLLGLLGAPMPRHAVAGKFPPPFSIN
jgi:uncharacterized protein